MTDMFPLPWEGSQTPQAGLTMDERRERINQLLNKK